MKKKSRGGHSPGMVEMSYELTDRLRAVSRRGGGADGVSVGIERGVVSAEPRRSLALGAVCLLCGCFSPTVSGIVTEGDGGVASDGATDAETEGGDDAAQVDTGADPDQGGSTSGAGSGSADGMATSDSATSGGDSEAGDSSTPTEEAGTDSGSSGSEGKAPALDCVDVILDELGTAAFDTHLGGAAFEGTCGGANTREAVFEWIAPFSDYFIFDTSGSSIDTALYLLEGHCDGAELECIDNAVPDDRIVRYVEAGTRLLAVVDSFTGQSGDVVLNVDVTRCPAADLDGVTYPHSFSTVGGTNAYQNECGGSDHPERTFRFTASQSGYHSFRATSDAFQPVLTLERGAACGGESLQCNTTVGTVGAKVSRWLDAGEIVTIYVDGLNGEGDVDLDVEILDQTCPSGEVVLGERISIFDHAPGMTLSCNPAGYDSGFGDRRSVASTLAWTSPGQHGDNSGCDLTVVGMFPFSISLQAGGTCAGAELQCAVGQLNSETGQTSATVSVGHIPPTEFTLTVLENLGPGLGVIDDTFEVQLECWASVNG